MCRVLKVNRTSYYHWAKIGCKLKRIDSKLNELIEFIFIEGKNKLGEREFSTSIVKLLEKECDEILSSPDFPKQLVDNKPRKKGIEIKF